MIDRIIRSNRLSALACLLFFSTLFAACFPSNNGLPAEPAAVGEPETAAVESAPETAATEVPKPAPAFTLPHDLAPISPENAPSLRELASVYPYFPPYFHISDDGARFAVGDMQTVEIRETAGGALLSSIPAVLPDCDFGFDRYFRLNADGSFIALVNNQNIEVWQAGGGLIYTNPLGNDFSSNAPACGADLPELALSPDGSLLAISGIAYAKTTSRRYFRVVDVRANETVFEWDGTQDSPHGNLYTFYGLGFSDDGRLLQTFDPTRFIRSEGELQRAFRFWSLETWQEVEGADYAITRQFKPGRLLFTWAEDGMIEVRSRISGAATGQIPMAGCQWDAPCETRFSADGHWAVVLEPSAGQFIYKNDHLNSSFTVWDLTENKAAARGSGALRDLESVQVKEDGNLIRTDLTGGTNALDSENNGWWTFREYFNGLLTGRDGKVLFTPLAADGREGCQFCSTCEINTKPGAITCSEGITDAAGGVITLKSEGGKINAIREVSAGQSALGSLSMPEMENPDTARVRILGYAPQQQILFYCVDENRRQAGCFIYDTELAEILKSPEDISYLRFSDNGTTAAYFDSAENALFLFDLPAKKLTRKYPYQARGYPVNSLFSNRDSTFLYVIQNLNNASDLSVETLDAMTWKSYGRTSLREAGVVSPTAFLESADGRLWVFAGKSGEVWLLNADDGLLLHKFQAHLDDIIGMALAPDGTWLLTMGENGILKFWGIEE